MWQRVTVAVVFLGLIAVLALAVSATHIVERTLLDADGHELDRRLLRRTEETLASDVSLMASGVPGRVPDGAEDRPSPVDLRFRARSADSKTYRERPLGGAPAPTGSGRGRETLPGGHREREPRVQETGGLSVGFNILLPHEEQDVNEYCDIGLTFDHFYRGRSCS